MDGSLGLIVRMPALEIDWETLVSVNLPTLLFVIVGVPLALVGYIVGSDVLVRRLPKRSQSSVRPWVWVGPAILFVGVILVYPMVGTIVRSVFDRHGSTFVGLGNFTRLLT
ncbi:MAG: sugar ABC transporter permease, partial [Chloroflexi bacterium]